MDDIATIDAQCRELLKSAGKPTSTLGGGPPSSSSSPTPQPLAIELQRLVHQLEAVKRAAHGGGKSTLARSRSREQLKVSYELPAASQNGGDAARRSSNDSPDSDYDEEDDEELDGLNSLSPKGDQPPLIRQVSVSRVVNEADIENTEIAIEEPDELFAPRKLGCMGRFDDVMARVRPGAPKKKKPSKSMAIQLNDPMCDPNTLLYCLFRYRRNKPLVTILLEKLELSTHPETDSYTLHLCYLMLIEELAMPLEQWLVARTKTSLHFALQVYWFCQGMIEDHDSRPGASNYKRFLRIQREVQTGVGHQAEQRANTIMTDEHSQHGSSYAKDRKGKLRSLQATNRALADAVELRNVFRDVTRFVEQVTNISITLRQTEPRSERDTTLIRELETLQKTLPPSAHLPAGSLVGSFQKVLSILPYEAKSFSTRERNPYMLVLEVSEVVETEDGLADSESIASSIHELRTKRSRGAGATLARAVTAPGRVALRAGGKALHGVAYGVGGAISLSRAGVGATVEGVRERKAKHQQRREAALAQENDPFAITETHEEKTARMQQTAPPPAASLNGADTVYRSTTPEVHSEHAEAWAERQERIRKSTHLLHVPGWSLAAVLVKADDDLRQEMFCMHLISLFQKAFRLEHLDVLAFGLRPYSIQATSSNSGLIEALPDAVSVAEIKRQMLKSHNSSALEMHYRQRFRRESEFESRPSDGASSPFVGEVSLEEAQRNCMHSVAAYAVVQYILQLKDRHNGNILIDSVGRMVHIDFAYMLGWAPGGITFEKSAFKLTKDVVDVWGGRSSPLWDEFVELVIAGLLAVQAHHALILRDVELIAASGARFPFLKEVVELGGFQMKTLSKSKKRILQLLRRRFKLYKSPQKLRSFALMMIEDAYENFWTRTYAKFQLLTNGIPP